MQKRSPIFLILLISAIVAQVSCINTGNQTLRNQTSGGSIRSRLAEVFNLFRHDQNFQHAQSWFPPIKHPQLYWDHRGRPHKTFKMGKLTGTGYFSKVYKGQDLIQKSECAVKVLYKHNYTYDESRMTLEHEFQVLQALPKNDSHICAYRRFQQTNRHIYQIFDFCPGEILYNLFKPRRPEAEAKQIAWAVLEAIRALHSYGIYHMDFSHHNILMYKGKARLLDFGSAVIGDVPRMSYVLAAPGYEPPEDFLGTKRTPSKVDTWFMGHHIFQLVYGDVWAFGSNTDWDYIQRTIKGKVKYPYPPSPILRDLLSKIFVPEPKRITLEEIAAHPWFSTK